MAYNQKTISEVVKYYINRTTYIPAMQREYVWDTSAIERLFDSLMSGFPIGSFLFWRIRQENKDAWDAYEFIRQFDEAAPHNREASLRGVNNDIYLVLDGQQRLTSLYLGLMGSYRFFYYRWHETKLYINLFSEPKDDNGDDPVGMSYDFRFRPSHEKDVNDGSPQFWYQVGNILDYEDAEEAKAAIEEKLSEFPDSLKSNANRIIGRLHSKIHTSTLLNYYEENTQDYNKVVEIFIRTNTGGVKLEYSDILLSVATARWRNKNAREELHSFTDEINKIGAGYSFSKDFVLKACLYLTRGLPIKYKVSNFTTDNLEKIEDNWDNITKCVRAAINLVSSYGFNDKNLVSKTALLPIALYISLSGKYELDVSTENQDSMDQIAIQKWISLVLLKNSFGGSTDTTLKSLQEVFYNQTCNMGFPFNELNKCLGIEPKFSDDEVETILRFNYRTKYSYLVLSLLYPDRDWRDAQYHEDHIFPKSEFTHTKLRQRGYQEQKIGTYLSKYNSLANLQLLTRQDNVRKNAAPFSEWLQTRDNDFKCRHSIPSIESYELDHFDKFIEARSSIIQDRLRNIFG